MTGYWKLICFLAACFSLLAAPVVLWIEQEGSIDLLLEPEPTKDQVWQFGDVERDEKSWMRPFW
jgi:hypothetical protein